jgi:hypothetical protein
MGMLLSGRVASFPLEINSFHSLAQSDIAELRACEAGTAAKV